MIMDRVHNRIAALVTKRTVSSFYKVLLNRHDINSVFSLKDNLRGPPQMHHGAYILNPTCQATVSTLLDFLYQAGISPNVGAFINSILIPFSCLFLKHHTTQPQKI
jgi:hypothetical protein